MYLVGAGLNFRKKKSNGRQPIWWVRYRRTRTAPIKKYEVSVNSVRVSE